MRVRAREKQTKNSRKMNKRQSKNSIIGKLHAEYSEKVVERHLTERVKALGGVCLKYANANMAGYPDRLVCLPGGRLVWVELKSHGIKPRLLQSLRHAELQRLGFDVRVLDSKAAVDACIAEWRTEL